VTSPSLALRATGLLADFNGAGVLSAADVHVAQRVGALAGEADQAVLLALALTVRSTRLGSVVLDLDTAAASTSVDVDVDVDEPAQAAPVDLDWPDDWVDRCRRSPLLDGPLHMAGSRLWLSRYWEQEELVADELLARSAEAPGDLDLALLREGLVRLFPEPDDADQREAAAVCALARVSVLAGGPGTGKTTTVSRLLALLREQHPTCRIALAAPTGKAAARLEEAVRSSAAELPLPDQARLPELSATTLHRLLGWRPEARTRFRHDRGNRLPYEVVVIDESSMLSLTLMARLLEALRPTTRLVLVGDPDQLASVEAGAVLGDLVAGSTGSPGAGTPATGVPAASGATTGRTPARAAALRTVLPTLAAPVGPDSRGGRVRDGVATLRVNRRFPEQSGIAMLAAAVQEGRGADAVAVLRMQLPDVELIEVGDDAFVEAAPLAAVRADVEQAARTMHDAASRADAGAALAGLEQHRLLCAHRRGARGVAHWSALVARWLAETQPVAAREDGHHLGEPLLVTTNDYEVGLYNGDTGIVVSDGAGGLTAAFGRGGAPILVPLARLGAVTRLHAMTVHRSQGSQFEVVTVVLPPAGSPLGTRQTLYTAVSRAMTRVRLVGSVEAVLAAVAQPAARATGLADRLR
jgi:exodeoxyribonuclease V alpha subunit